MVILLAPSKTMDTDSETPSFVISETPLFLKKASELAHTLSELSEAELATTMHSSPAIAAQVKHMYAEWKHASRRAALWAYRGDVYKGMKADELTARQALWAQKHLVIMSGLYGIVRPFDAVCRYRLEMKAVVPYGLHHSKKLYDFWEDDLAKYVAAKSDGVVYKLCSAEYSDVVIKRLPKDIRVITPMFYDKKPNGKIGVAPIYSKMMRGVMARWMIDHEVEKPEELQAFTMHGYSYDASRSTADRPAFYREVMKPLVF